MKTIQLTVFVGLLAASLVLAQSPPHSVNIILPDDDPLPVAFEKLNSNDMWLAENGGGGSSNNFFIFKTNGMGYDTTISNTFTLIGGYPPWIEFTNAPPWPPDWPAPPGDPTCTNLAGPYFPCPPCGENWWTNPCGVQFFFILSETNLNQSNYVCAPLTAWVTGTYDSVLDGRYTNRGDGKFNKVGSPIWTNGTTRTYVGVFSAANALIHSFGNSQTNPHLFGHFFKATLDDGTPDDKLYWNTNAYPTGGWLNDLRYFGATNYYPNTNCVVEGWPYNTHHTFHSMATGSVEFLVVGMPLPKMIFSRTNIVTGTTNMPVFYPPTNSPSPPVITDGPCGYYLKFTIGSETKYLKHARDFLQGHTYYNPDGSITSWPNQILVSPNGTARWYAQIPPVLGVTTPWVLFDTTTWASSGWSDYPPSGFPSNCGEP